MIAEIAHGCAQLLRVLFLGMFVSVVLVSDVVLCVLVFDLQ